MLLLNMKVRLIYYLDLVYLKIRSLQSIIVLLASLVLLSSTLSAQHQFGGKIVDENNELLVGVNIVLIGTNAATMSNSDGFFSLSVDKLPANIALAFSYIGYKTQIKEFTTNELVNSTELAISLTPSAFLLSEMTVTATRTRSLVEDVPLAVERISEEQISSSGNIQLNEVLAEQAGLQIVEDHGTGLQMQGLSSEYILILVDGEPLVGRMAGTLDLSRIAVGDIQEIEVIQGASSALYGNEALAGVVNIITKQSDDAWSLNLSQRAQTHNRISTDINASTSFESLKLQTYINRQSSNGLDLNEEVFGTTLPAYDAYTFQQRMAWKISPSLELSISGRFYTEDQKNTAQLNQNGELAEAADFGRRKDWTFNPILNWHYNDRNRTEFRYFLSGYDTFSEFRFTSNDSVQSSSTFNQQFERYEVLNHHLFTEKTELSIGAGQVTEQLDALRYDGLNQFRSNYALIQLQMSPSKSFRIVGGLRYDTHSEYQNRWSPKFSASYQALDRLRFYASVGSGFKAPDFRQLALNFTNPIAGYSVIGTSKLDTRLQQMQDDGLISSDIDIANLLSTFTNELRAESAISFNTGFNFRPFDKLAIGANLFRNQIRDLIDTFILTTQTNQQNLFTYRNISRVQTQGISLNAGYYPEANLQFDLGYQFLDTKDLDVYNQLEEGQLFRRNPATGISERVLTSEYGGLFNRSRHTASAKLRYTYSPLKWTFFLRANYRGRFAFRDVNSNQIADVAEEFQEGRWLLNLSTHKNFGNLKIELGAINLSNERSFQEPSLAGRRLYIGVSYALSN